VPTGEVAAGWGRPLTPMSSGATLDNEFLVARR
jgi:hypothetical protein